MSITRTCENPECDRVFTTSNAQQKYCCAKCYKRAAHLRYYPAHRREIIQHVVASRKAQSSAGEQEQQEK